MLNLVTPEFVVFIPNCYDIKQIGLIFKVVKMHKILVFILFIASLSAQAASKELLCEVSFNTTKVLQQKVILEENKKNQVFGEFEEFTFFITSKGKNVIEIHALNNNEPSRTYATGVIDSASSFVDLAVWKREYLLEVRCTQ